jgi:hypothetical protein
MKAKGCCTLILLNGQQKLDPFCFSTPIVIPVIIEYLPKNAWVTIKEVFIKNGIVIC